MATGSTSEIELVSSDDLGEISILMEDIGLLQEVQTKKEPLVGEELPSGFFKKNISKWAIIKYSILVGIVGMLISTLCIKYLKEKIFEDIHLFKWLELALALFGGKIWCSWLLRIAVCIAERNFSSKKQYLYLLYGIRKAATNLTWSVLVLIAWRHLLDTEVIRETRAFVPWIIDIILKCFLVGSSLWLVKTTIAKLSAIYLHRNAKMYFDGIEEALFNRYIIEMLSGPPKEVRCWNARRLLSIILDGSLATLDEQVLEAYANESNQSEDKAKAMASRIFHNVANRDNTFIYLEEIMCFITEEEAAKIMNIFEGMNERMRMSRSALKDWMVNVFKERRQLAVTLDDSKTAISALHRVLSFLVGIIIVVASLYITTIIGTKTLFYASVQATILVAIFANLLKVAVKGIIFLFVIQPYNVGDQIVIEDVQMVVKKINVLSTVFEDAENKEILYTNEFVASKGIKNNTRVQA